MEYIREHYDEKLTIEALTKRSRMSRPTFHRKFRMVTQMTPMEYVIQCRVHAARTLLAQGKSRTETAQQCGFYDTSHMNKYLSQEQS